MNGKFFEVLLAAAVVFTATDWGFKGLQDIGPRDIYYNPNELLNDQATATSSFGTNSPGDQDESFFTLKEEQHILNTIINLEESQTSSGRGTVSQNYFAYPLFLQNSNETSNSNHNIDAGSRLQELSFDIQDGGSQDAVRPPSWPPSPSSPIDDGELFGAVGYAPLRDNQYFDIESFLNADFPSEVATETALGSLFSSPSLTRQTSVSPEHTEAIEQIAELLGASIDSPNSPEFSPKRGPTYPKQFTSVEGAEVDDGNLQLGVSTHSYQKSSMIDGTSTVDEFESLLQNVEDAVAKSKRKVNAITEIQSYDHVQKPSVVLKKKVKNEPASPSSESDCSTQSHSTDFEFTDNASSVSSGFDQLQTDQGKKQLFPEDQRHKIWLDLPYTKHDMIRSKIEDFNEIITQLDPLRQHVAKEIRRKGKNKLAARNCRKRKIDAIDKLDVGVSELEKQKQILLDERLQLELEREEIVRKTEYLYEHIFKNLRDESGLPYSKDNYALTYTADGTVYLVPTKNQDSESIKSR